MTPTRETSSHSVVSYCLDVIKSIVLLPLTIVQVLRDIGRDVVRYRRLLLEMTWRELADPFAGSFLGVAWSVLHPLLMMAVYATVFSIIFRGSPEENVHGFDYTMQMISAYLPWMAMTNSLLAGCAAIRNKAGLVKQVVFPLEVLPIKTVLANLVPQIIGTAFLFCYGLVRFHEVPWTWALWPIMFAFEVMLLSGMVMAVSAIGVYLRDLGDVLQVLFMILFYATPVLYTERTLHLNDPTAMKVIDFMLTFNPASMAVRPYRDACFFGEIRYGWTWMLYPIVSVLMLVIGYRVFRKLKPYFGNAL